MPTTDILTTRLSFDPASSLDRLLSAESFAVLDPFRLSNSALELPLASAAASISETITALDTVQGTLTLTNGLLTADLTTPFGSWQEAVDLVTLATELNQSFQEISGTLNLTGGIASGNLTIDGQDFSGSFEFANLMGGFVTNFVETLNGTASFANGQIAIDLPTALGDVEGTIGFGSGALVVDLETSLGAIDFSLDFPDDAQYAIPIPQLGGAAAILDLAGGELEVDLISFLPGAEIVLPLTSLAGTVGFTNGFATVSVDSSFGSYSFQFNLAEEVGEELTEFLTRVTGTLGISSGQLSANLSTDFGSFAGTLNAGQQLTDLITTLPQYGGTLTFAAGSVVADLITPTGTIVETIDYGQYLDDIAAVVEDLGAIG